MSWKDTVGMRWYGTYEAVGTGATPGFHKVSDHNRAPISIDVERIEKKKRMADGTLRRYSVAKKHTFSTSWKELPSKRNVSGFLTTVDNGMSAKELEYFHDNENDAFQIKVVSGDGTETLYTVMMTDFSMELSKRGLGIDFYDVSVTLEEV